MITEDQVRAAVGHYIGATMISAVLLAVASISTGPGVWGYWVNFAIGQAAGVYWTLKAVSRP